MKITTEKTETEIVCDVCRDRMVVVNIDGKVLCAEHRPCPTEWRLSKITDNSRHEGTARYTRDIKPYHVETKEIKFAIPQP